MNLDAVPWWAFALLSALFAALTTILAKLGIAGVDSNVATAIRTAVIVVIAWGIVAATGATGTLRSLTPKTWIFLVLSGIATGLSWLCYFRALQRGPTTSVATIDKLSLAMILVLSALVLHEPLTWKTALGTVLVTAGTLVVLAR